MLARRAASRRRAYSYLSPPEFQDLVGDLLGALDGGRYSRHSAGRDGGVDLRRTVNGRLEVVQAKHYLGFDYPHLLAELKKERPKVERIAPALYSVATSLPLTKQNKDEIARLFAPFLSSSDRVFGLEDLDQLLDANASIELRHAKLWLSSSAVLDGLIHAGSYAKSETLRREIYEALPKYVQCDSFLEAHEKLHTGHVCVIAGPPGVGKTMLARMLLADSIGRGYQPVYVSSDIDEAWEMWRPESAQVFYYDDFLGQANLVEHGLRKNEDAEIVRFLDQVSKSKGKLAVLTTREYILEQAQQLYYRLTAVEEARFKLILAMEEYSRLDKAKILFNHMYFSNVSGQARRELVSERSYLRIVDHENYTPRLVEQFTLSEEGRGAEGGFVSRALDLLDHPDQLWRSAFSQLTGEQQAVLLVLLTMPVYADLEDLHVAWQAFTQQTQGHAPRESFKSLIKILVPTFFEIVAYRHVGRAVHIHKPAVSDLLVAYLRDVPELVPRLLLAARFFEQVQKLVGYSRWGTVYLPRGGRRRLAPVETLPAPPSTGVSEKVRELFAGPTAARQVLQLGNGKVDISQMRAVPELRTRFVAELCSQAEFEELRPFFRSCVGELLNRWAQPAGDPTLGLPILRVLQEADWVGDDEFRMFLTNTRDALMDAYELDAFDALLELRREWPDAFTAPEWDDARQRFFEYADDRLSGPVISGIDEIESTANEYGVNLDRQLEEARQSEPEPDDPDDRATYRYTEAQRDEQMSRAEEEAAMANLFAELYRNTDRN